MKYIKSYELYRNTVNEELLGNAINFLKGLWSKAMDELKKLGNNPNTDQIKKWISDNPFNPSDNNFLFKNIMDDFKKKPECNDQDALNLIDSILNPETGVMGKQGLSSLLETLQKTYPPKKGESTSSQYATFEYILDSIRKKTIIRYKFAGSTDGNVDQKKINIDLKDTIHLPDVKKLLISSTDNKKKKDSIINWCEKTLFPQMDKFNDEIKDDDIVKYLQSKKISLSGGVDSNSMTYDKLKEFFDKKIKVIYLLKDKKKIEWDELSDDQKKNPEDAPTNTIVGVKLINSLNDLNKEDSIVFLDKDNNPTIKKSYNDIIGPFVEDRSEEAKKAAESLGKIKNDSDKMNKVAKFADFLQNDMNKEKIKEIEKILNDNEK